MAAASVILVLLAGVAPGGEHPPLGLHPDNPRRFLFPGREFEDRTAEIIAETEAGLPNRQLIEMNIANRSKLIEEANPLVSIFDFHYAIPPETVAMDARVRGVIGDNETDFEGPDDVLHRTEGWGFKALSTSPTWDRYPAPLESRISHDGAVLTSSNPRG